MVDLILVDLIFRLKLAEYKIRARNLRVLIEAPMVKRVREEDVDEFEAARNAKRRAMRSLNQGMRAREAVAQIVGDCETVVDDPGALGDDRDFDDGIATTTFMAAFDSCLYPEPQLPIFDPSALRPKPADENRPCFDASLSDDRLFLEWSKLEVPARRKFVLEFVGEHGFPQIRDARRWYLYANKHLCNSRASGDSVRFADVKRIYLAAITILTAEPDYREKATAIKAKLDGAPEYGPDPTDISIDNNTSDGNTSNNNTNISVTNISNTNVSKIGKKIGKRIVDLVFKPLRAVSTRPQHTPPTLTIVSHLTNYVRLLCRDRMPREYWAGEETRRQCANGELITQIIDSSRRVEAVVLRRIRAMRAQNELALCPALSIILSDIQH